MGAERIERLDSRLAGALRAGAPRDEAIRATVEAVRDLNPLCHWTGVYLLEGEELVLAHEIGRPTPHRRIPLDKGLCGAAAREGRTIVVDDVRADSRYLACTLETRSEIVVPIRGGDGRVLGEIDIDSDAPAAFQDADRIAVERAAARLGAFLDATATAPRSATAGPHAAARRRETT